MSRTIYTSLCICLVCLPLASAQAEDARLEQQVQAVLEENRQLRTRLEALEDEVRSARDDAASARALAEGENAQRPGQAGARAASPCAAGWAP